MFVRGFKAWCENVALQYRRKLCLLSHDPLQASQLADYLGVDVKTPQEIPGVDSKTLRVLLKEDSDSWSAITISNVGKKLVIMNPSHRGGRPNSDLMHELSHVLLGHKAGQSFISGDGLLILSAFEKSQEDEANWLAGTLLLPRAVLVHIRERHLPEDQIIRRYRISRGMLRYRVNVTGVDLQMKRRSGARSRAR